MGNAKNRKSERKSLCTSLVIYCIVEYHTEKQAKGARIMLNHIIIMGRLVHDPELRHTQSGTSVCTITLAVDRDYRPKDGGEKQTDFIDVVAWGQRADFVAKYFSKGRQVVAEGSLQSRKWTDKNGVNRTNWEVRADNFYFADSRRDGQNGNGGNSAPAKSSAPQNSAPYHAPTGFTEIEEDGDLPF